jgi:OmpA-OmpF porin, OOP family
MKTTFNLLAILLLAISPPAAMAENSNLYGAIDLGQSTSEDSCKNLPAGYSCTKTATAYRISGGYQFTPTLGIEVGYGDYGTTKLSAIAIPGLTWNAEAKMSGLTLAATGSFPISESFSLLGKLGIARTSVKSSGSGAYLGTPLTPLSSSFSSTTATYGLGAQYSLTKSLAIRAQYDDLGVVGDATNGKSRITLLTAGVVVKF